jgi:predicted ribosomally synthesized peptide with SipW-like signal peptide
MKRILLSLVMIVLASSTAVGATRAYFTATDTVSNNILNSGKMVFDLRADAKTLHLPFQFTNLLPGVISATSTDIVNIFNHADSSEMKYRLYFAYTGGNGNLYNNMRFNSYRCNWYSGGDCGSWTQITSNGWIKDFDGTTGYILSPVNINPNNSTWWKIETWLDSAAGNSLQGATATFNLIGNGTQPINSGWTE